jgi:hypothetical protein
MGIPSLNSFDSAHDDQSSWLRLVGEFRRSVEHRTGQLRSLQRDARVIMLVPSCEEGKAASEANVSHSIGDSLQRSRQKTKYKPTKTRRRNGAV